MAATSNPLGEGGISTKFEGRALRRSSHAGAIGIFLAVVFGSSWGIAIPLWVDDGLSSEWFPVLALAMMFTPAIAAIVAVFLVERPSRPAQALGLLPLKPVRRLVGYLAFGLVVPVALVFLAILIGAAFGMYPADFARLSAFQDEVDAQLAASGASELGVPIGVIAALQLINILIATFINLIPALGEEIGWRGWLLPKLMKLGVVPALALSGVIWGLWHAPLVLLGYNYPDVPGWLALILMVGMCTVMGSVLAWLRLRSDSVWPAALAHGSLNAAAPAMMLLFAESGRPVATAHATILGWSGWIVPIVFVVVLLVTGQLKPLASSQGHQS